MHTVKDKLPDFGCVSMSEQTEIIKNLIDQLERLVRIWQYQILNDMAKNQGRKRLVYTC